MKTVLSIVVILYSWWARPLRSLHTSFTRFRHLCNMIIPLEVGIFTLCLLLYFGFSVNYADKVVQHTSISKFWKEICCINKTPNVEKANLKDKRRKRSNINKSMDTIVQVSVMSVASIIFSQLLDFIIYFCIFWDGYMDGCYMSRGVYISDLRMQVLINL